MRNKIIYISLFLSFIIGISIFLNTNISNLNDLENSIKKDSYFGKGIKIYPDKQEKDKIYITSLIKSDKKPELIDTYNFLKKYSEVIVSKNLNVSAFALSIIYNNKNYGIIIGVKQIEQFHSVEFFKQSCHNTNYLGQLSDTCSLSPAWDSN